jgi:hypothetical protein
MCHYITACVPANTDLKALRAVVGAHKHGFQPVANDWVAAQLPAGDHYLCLTRKICDCGTVLGCARDGNEAKANASERAERAATPPRGWSEARIARWRAEKERAAEKQRHERAASLTDRTAEAEAWIDFLRAVLEPRIAARFGLLLHTYRSNPDSERIQLRRLEDLSLSRVTPELLMKIEEDVLYQFLP